jgi:hypothetical protein
MQRTLAITFALCAIASAGKPRLSRTLEAHVKAQEIGMCEVHDIRMVRHVREKSYGLPMYAEGYTAASRRFPNWRPYLNGGGEVPQTPEKAAVYVCPECRRRARAWALKHPEDSPAQDILCETKT